MNWEMVSVSELKIRLHEIVNQAAKLPIVVVRRSRPVAVLLSYARWAELHREIEDLKDRLALYKSRESPPDLRLPHEKIVAELGIVGGDTGSGSR